MKMKFLYRVPFASAISDRVEDWIADRKIRTMQAHFAPLKKAALDKKDRNEWGSLDADEYFEYREIIEPVYARKAERLIAKARKYGVSVPPHPTDPNEDSDDWYLGQAAGDWLLTKKLEERLQREVRIESRASYDEFRKWTTLLFALLGFSLAFYSIRLKQKQPDPCQVNYYRNDSGECVFVGRK